MTATEHSYGSIPTFEGRDVHAARLAFSGSVDTGQVLRDDDEVTFVVRGKVTKVAHQVDSFGVRRRVHSIKVAHAVEADADTEAWALEQMKREEDERTGQQSLDGELDGELDGDPDEG